MLVLRCGTVDIAIGVHGSGAGGNGGDAVVGRRWFGRLMDFLSLAVCSAKKARGFKGLGLRDLFRVALN